MTTPRWLLWTLLALALPACARAAVLRDASFEDNSREAVLMLKFDAEPSIRYTPMTDSRILILDFANAAFPSGKEKFAPRTQLVEYLSIAQFDREKLRLVLKVATGTVVNVYRYPVPGRTEIRYAVVVERESSLDRFPVVAGKKTRPRIVIDPGHGGHDNGAIGTLTTDKEVGLAVAREIKRLFDADPRVEVFYTRLSDHFIPLEDRSGFARRVEADAFVSFHANMMIRDSWTKGVEVWYLSDRGAQKEVQRVLSDKGVIASGTGPRRRPVMSGGGVDQIILSMQQGKTLSQSSLMSRILNRNLQHWTGQESRGVKRSNFKVLRPHDIPSCLVEFGFLSNPEEEKLMTTKLWQQRAARAVYDGIMEWMARTGRITGTAARGLIQAAVSEEERGEMASGVEEEFSGERVSVSTSRATTRTRAPAARKPAARRSARR
jgi:N-acetylmuramoyl-L-alanine amidase